MYFLFNCLNCFYTEHRLIYESHGNCVKWRSVPDCTLYILHFDFIPNMLINTTVIN